MESENQFVYHGSVTSDITEFEPRKRYTPSGTDVLPRIYASPNPMFAAAHSFPWSSDEGIDVTFDNGKTILVVPEQHKDRLNQPVYIYKIDSTSFELTEEEKTGETYHSNKAVTPTAMTSFNSVIEAIEHFGGRVKIV
jgi:hypothetical protein